MIIRSFLPWALVAGLISCSPGPPDPSPSSLPPDSVVGLTTEEAQRPPPRDPGAPGVSSRDPRPGAGLLTPDGWGPLRIGMSRDEVVAAAGEDANPEAVGGPEPERCDEFRPTDAPEGVLVMVEDDVLTRISVSRTPDIETPEGFSVGDRGVSVLEAYGGQARVEDHRYQEAPAMYITVWRASPREVERRGIRYEVNSDGTVIHLRAGGPSIEYFEGCV